MSSCVNVINVAPKKKGNKKQILWLCTIKFYRESNNCAIAACVKWQRTTVCKEKQVSEAITRYKDESFC